MVFQMIRGICLTVLLISACVYDLKSCRIPNALCGSFCIAGWCLSLAEYGPPGLLHSTLSTLIPIAGLFILYAFHVLGAGDIKLLSAVGSMVSFRIIRVMACAFSLCALYGLIVLSVHLLQKKLCFSRTHFSIWIAAGTLAAAIIR